MRHLAPGVVVIGRYCPDSLAVKTIRDHIDTVITEASVARYQSDGIGEVRSPYSNHVIKSDPLSAANSWHRDGGNMSVDPRLAMVIWSNREQTEIRLPNGTVIHPEPFDILLIKNTAVLHKTPDTISEDRWFYRKFVIWPEGL